MDIYVLATVSTDQQQSLELYQHDSVPVNIEQPLEQYHTTPNQQRCQSCHQSLTQMHPLPSFGSQQQMDAGST